MENRVKKLYYSSQPGLPELPAVVAFRSIVRSLHMSFQQDFVNLVIPHFFSKGIHIPPPIQCPTSGMGPDIPIGWLFW
jgi:hypothetical protein